MNIQLQVARTLLLGLPAFVFVGMGLSPSASADEPERTRCAYHLFAPVPVEEMREMSTDRPDTTESPYTVDAGHFQVEMDVAILAIDHRNGTRTTSVDFIPMNLKLGLASFADLQLVVEPFHTTTVSQGRVPLVEEQGYGATTLRLKLNLYGNDGGDTALALMPYITHDHGVTEGGLIVPFGASLPANFGFGAMLQGDLVQLDSGRYGFELLSTLTLGHDIAGPFAFYVEAAATVAAYDFRASRLAIDGGITCGLTDNFQLDVGTRVGVIGDLSDIELFTGISARL